MDQQPTVWAAWAPVPAEAVWACVDCECEGRGPKPEGSRCGSCNFEHQEYLAQQGLN